MATNQETSEETFLRLRREMRLLGVPEIEATKNLRSYLEKENSHASAMIMTYIAVPSSEKAWICDNRVRLWDPATMAFGEETYTLQEHMLRTLSGEHSSPPGATIQKFALNCQVLLDLLEKENE